MPRIKSYTPPWLTEPAPGHSLFSLSDGAQKASTFSPYTSKKKPDAGPRRTIARRGTEVFVANGRELKWGDLVSLKDAWEAEHGRRGYGTPGLGRGRQSNGESHSGSYRIIRTPVAEDIRQLVMSPNEDYLAVLTSHTVHICLLPDSSHLTAEDQTPLKPRYFTLGSTTHVTSRSPIASAVWHPLGVNGSSLVTVTKDAVVRVWELSPQDRWSFDTPTLAVDLKKLADGTYLDQDFSASTATTNQTYSPDLFEMEVAAACFGGSSSGGWSSMTLWIAMRGGDVYALCPLLPRLWAPPPTLIPSLSISIVAKVAAMEDDPEVPAHVKLLAQQQLDWMSDLDKQDPRIVETPMGEIASEIYTRPSQPGIVPRLQGPFDLELDPDSELDQDLELCDIHVIGEKIDTEDLMMGEEEDVEVDDIDQEGLSLSVICLLSTSGRVRICLDLDGIEAQWLPPRSKSRASALTAEPDAPSLLTFQTLDVVRERERRPDGWPTFSPDVTSRYSFFITHTFGITYISLSPWVFRLEQELQADTTEGADLRIDLLVKGHSTTRERVYTHSQDTPLAACTVIRDPDLGYFLLSATHRSAVALVFETPEDLLRASVARGTPQPYESVLAEEEEEKERQSLSDFLPTRPYFQAPEELDQKSELERAKAMLFSSRYQVLRDQQVRLSPATLEIFTNAHRLVGAESGRLNRAAALLFTKLESLPVELHEQITKANMVKQRIDRVAGLDVDHEQPISDDVRLRQRLRDAQERQDKLTARMESLKRTVNRAVGRDLSDKEKQWMQEVQTLEASLIPPGEGKAGSTALAARSPSKTKQPWQRVEELRSLKEDLIAQAEALRKQGDGTGAQEGVRSPSAPSLKVPADIRKAKVAQVMKLLERETALVEAVKNRLDKLYVG